MKRIIYLTIIFSAINQLTIQKAKSTEPNTNIDKKIEFESFQRLNNRFPNETNALIKVLQNHFPNAKNNPEKSIIEYCESPYFEIVQTLLARGRIKSLIQLNDEFLAANCDQTIMIWQRVNNLWVIKDTFHFPDSIVYSLVKLKNGDFACCLKDFGDSNDCTPANLIKIWHQNFSKWECIQTMLDSIGIRNDFKNIIELENGDLLTCFRDNTKIWRLNRVDKWECIQTFFDRELELEKIIELDNGDLAVGYWNGTQKIWRKSFDSSFKSIQDFRNHGRTPKMLKLKNGDLLSYSFDHKFSVCRRNEKDIWEVIQHSYLCHRDLSNAVIELSNGDIAFGFNDGTIKIWRKIDGYFECVETIINDDKIILSFCELDNGDLAYGNGNKLRILKRPFGNLFRKPLPIADNKFYQPKPNSDCVLTTIKPTS